MERFSFAPVALLFCYFSLSLAKTAESTEEISIQASYSFLDNLRLEILARYLENETARSVKIKRNKTGCLPPPSIHLKMASCSSLSPPVVQIQNGPEFCTIGFGHSNKGQLEAVRAFMEYMEWRNLVEYPSSSFRDTSDFFSDRATVFVSCKSWKCYAQFRKRFSEWAESADYRRVAWILDEDSMRMAARDGSFSSSVELGNRLRVFGIKRAFTENKNAVRLSHLFQVINELEPDEEATSNSVYLYEAALTLHHLLNVGEAFSIDSRVLQHLDSKDAHVRLDSSGRIHQSYNIFELGETFTQLFAVYKKDKIHEISRKLPPESHAPKKRRKRDVVIPQCPPAKKGSNGKLHFRAAIVLEQPVATRAPGKPISGFSVDMMNGLAQALDFTYELNEAKDGIYGAVTINESTGEVNATGLIGQVLNCEVDLAVGALSISAEREAVIDLTKSWHDYGLILLTPAPAIIQSNIWSCFQPFSTGVWMIVLGALALVILSVPIMIAVTGKPFYGSLTDNLDSPGIGLGQRLYDSLWFLYSTGLARGPDGANLPVRIILAGFFAFMLIVTSTYTANLAAFLTAVRTVTPIRSVQDLAYQEAIPFGTVRQSAVEKTFLTSSVSPFKEIGTYMRNNPQWMVNTAEEGVDKVKNASMTNGVGYVFIWDSPVLSYYSQLKPCTAQVTGRTFSKKGYGIGMPKGMPYRSNFSLEILNMRAGRSLTSLTAVGNSLYENGECGVPGGGGGSEVAGISAIHIAGSVVFAFLVPLGIAALIASVQKVIRSRCSSSTTEGNRNENIQTNTDDSETKTTPL